MTTTTGHPPSEPIKGQQATGRPNKLIKFLLDFKHLINKKLSVKNQLDVYVSQFKLKSKNKSIQKFLDQEFELNNLKYYGLLGIEINKYEITKDYHVYRFESTQKRLEFVEYLLNKIYND